MQTPTTTTATVTPDPDAPVDVDLAVIELEIAQAQNRVVELTAMRRVLIAFAERAKLAAAAPGDDGSPNVTVDELAERWRCSDKTVLRRLAEGRIPGARRVSPKRNSPWKRIPLSGVIAYERGQE